MKSQHPMKEFLRMDRLPHIWCPGCGIGTVVNCFTQALKESGIPADDTVVVSGIGCSGRVAGYVDRDSFHATHGRALPLATGVKLANPKLKVTVVSGDGDIFAIGGNHFIHAARRNIDLLVICINNFTYGMTGGQVTPTTPLSAYASTTPFGNFEQTFNLPYLAESVGASYVARWTVAHPRRVVKSIREALAKPGFSFIEVLSPCPTLYGRKNKQGDGLATVQSYKKNAVIRDNSPARDADIFFDGPIPVGVFVNKDRPGYLDSMNDYLSKRLNDKFVKYEG